MYEPKPAANEDLKHHLLLRLISSRIEFVCIISDNGSGIKVFRTCRRIKWVEGKPIKLGKEMTIIP
jgi:hypothetical protein